LRAALNFAIREEILTENPVRRLEIPAYQKPLARVWTDGRVKQWQEIGERPAVAVWTAVHLAAFLAAVVEDSLYAMWWLIGLRGLRRGEACGLRWSDVDLDAGLLFVVRNRTTAGYEVFEGDPKTAAGVRGIALDRRTVAVLRAHRAAQEAARERRLAAGKLWVDSGYVFVRKDGSPLHPSYASTRFRLLIARTGMPPVRLHDLRHGTASLSHQAGADLKDIQELLGHSSILVTADTYTSVLPPRQRRVAEATAHLVLAAASRTRKKIKATARLNRPPTATPTGAPTPTRPGDSPKPQVSALSNDQQDQGGRPPTGSPRAPHRPHKTNKRNRRR
jgi:site-specific recombinase XerD